MEAVKQVTENQHGMRINVGQTERWLSIIGGSAAIIYGLTRRSWGGLGLALTGGGLLYRGATGHSRVYETLRLNTARKRGWVSVPYGEGFRVERSVTINRPAEELYRFWRNLENLPKFMQRLESVKVINGNRSHWVAKTPGGSTVRWYAEIHNEKENELIAWRSLQGADVDNAGSVRFKPAPGGRGTEVKVEIEYSPPGGLLGVAVAKLFGEDPERQVREDLRRFKQLMEAGEMATAKAQASAREQKMGIRAEQPSMELPTDIVEEASRESFPASDAPAWTVGTESERVL